MADDMQSKLSGIASGFNKALDSKGQTPEETKCPHCGLSPSDPSPSAAADPVNPSVGKIIGYPGS